LAGAHGAVLPDDLRLWALAGGRPQVCPGDLAAGAGTGGATWGAAESGCGSDAGDVDLGATLEAATSAPVRRARGLHVTPRWLADHLVELVLADALTPGSVCDPACGGGAFLLAAARALHARGVPRHEVVCERLWGADIDPVGLAAAEAALAIWSGGAVPPPGRLVVGDPLRAGEEVWPTGPKDGFDLVVGNPPFQSQLGRATARGRADQLRLRRRFGTAVRAYTDTAWLFLLLGCQLVRPGGRVVMVQPDSLAAARDAAAVRDAIDALACLDHLWVDDRRVFAAAVRVCAPVLRRLEGRPTLPGAGGAAGGPALAGDGSGAGESGPAGPGARATDGGTVGEPGRWHDLLAEASGVPALRLPVTAGRLGGMAAMLAGFRDEYYGLAAAVREAEGPGTAPATDLALGPAPATDPTPGTAPVPHPAPGGGPGEAAGGARLVTVGAIDWGRSAWGERPVRFAKRRWEAPVVDLERLAALGTAAAQRWVHRTRRPKVLVATQTKVLEVTVDEAGDWVPSVPVIAAVPRRPGDLWRVAAALAAPASTVWLLRRAPGAALARGALKVAARDLSDLPLPADEAAWAEAAEALQVYAAEPAPAALDAFVEAATRAQAAPPAVVAWWRERLGSVRIPV
jgi:hypothetical protein